MSWKNTLKQYNIEYIDYFPFPQMPNQLFVTRCSAKKNNIKQGTPKQLYDSNIIDNFIRFCEQNNFKYAILSDKYGSICSDEIVENYDVHPSRVSEQGFKNIGKVIQEKCKEKRIAEMYFYNTSPLMSVPYFKMLFYSGIKSYYLTQLKVECKNSLFDF